jgi:hypothetical protein
MTRGPAAETGQVQRLGVAAWAGAHAVPNQLPESTVAREKFKDKKSISSDEFFGLKSEGTCPLGQQFEGASSISSQELFGSPAPQNPTSKAARVRSAPARA